MDISSQAKKLLARGVPKLLVDKLTETAAALPEIVYECEAPPGTAIAMPAELPPTAPMQVAGGDDGDPEDWKKELWKDKNWDSPE